jgi:hypothetical protein
MVWGKHLPFSRQTESRNFSKIKVSSCRSSSVFFITESFQQFCGGFDGTLSVLIAYMARHNS